MGDRDLAVAMAHAALLESGLEGSRRGARSAAVDASKETLLFEGHEVATDGLERYAQLLGKLGRLDKRAAAHPPEYRLPSLLRDRHTHGPISFVLASRKELWIPNHLLWTNAIVCGLPWTSGGARGDLLLTRPRSSVHGSRWTVCRGAVPRCATAMGATTAESCVSAASEHRVLFLSGKTSTADQISCFAAGADDCLPKPYDDEELLAHVAVLLRRDRRGGD